MNRTFSAIKINLVCRQTFSVRKNNVVCRKKEISYFPQVLLSLNNFQQDY